MDEMSRQSVWKFDGFFVWIYNQHKQIIGAGFLVGEKEIATCAHVVRAALGLQDTPVDVPKGDIVISFPSLKQNNLSATVLAEGWSHEKDIAILRLNDDLSESAQPAKLYSGEVENHSFSVYGFPGRTKKGVLADGVIKGKREHGLVQLESTSGYAIQGGFSGGPVFDDQLNKVVGMVATSDLSVKVASMIPVDMLASVCNRAGVNLKLNIEGREKAMSFTCPRESKKILENCLKASFSEQSKGDLISIIETNIKDFARTIGYDEKIDVVIHKLISYCTDQNNFDGLWKGIKEKRKNRYDEFFHNWEDSYDKKQDAKNILPREIYENCLKESFTARDKDEFISLCMNYIPSVGRKLDDIRSVDWMINVLLDYCRNNNEYNVLWKIIKNSSKRKESQCDKFYQKYENSTSDSR